MDIWNKFYHGTPKGAVNGAVDGAKKIFGVAKDKVTDVANTLSGNKAVNLITDHNEKVTHIIIGMDNEITSINRKLSILESKFQSFRKYLILFLIISFIINVLLLFIIIIK